MDSGYGRKSSGAIYTEEQVGRALRSAGVRIAGEILTHYIVFCDYHDNFNTPSAEVDKRTGMFYCFSCKQTASLEDLLMHKKNWTYFQAIRVIGDSDYNIVEEIDSLLDDDPEPELFDQSVIDRLHRNVWGRGSQYLNSRNISNSTIEKFELGYSSKRDMVIVPVHDLNNNLRGFVARSVEGKRFKNNKGLKKSDLLFNANRCWTSPRVFVVESSFDAIRLWQVGMPAVATLGAGISNKQIDLLQKTFDDIIVIPDNDDAGKGMEIKILEHIPYAQIIWLEGVHDVGNLDDDDLTNL